jgi:hypothetical protein
MAREAPTYGPHACRFAQLRAEFRVRALRLRLCRDLSAFWCYQVISSNAIPPFWELRYRCLLGNPYTIGRIGRIPPVPPVPA